MAVVTAGEIAIGDRTIKNLIGEFKTTDDFFKSGDAILELSHTPILPPPKWYQPLFN